MTSPSVWAIIVAHFCSNWGNYTLLTCIPSYFHDALNLTMGSVSIEEQYLTIANKKLPKYPTLK